MDGEKYLGTDILLDDGTYSGQYNKIWRVEAYSDSTGVCVTNAAKGTNGLNAKYVLLPVTDDANSNSNTVAYQEKIQSMILRFQILHQKAIR